LALLSVCRAPFDLDRYHFSGGTKVKPQNFSSE